MNSKHSGGIRNLFLMHGNNLVRIWVEDGMTIDLQASSLLCLLRILTKSSGNNMDLNRDLSPEHPRLQDSNQEIHL